MQDIVLIPTFARPEYLALCLEHLANADGGPDKVVWISHDRHSQDTPRIEKEIENTIQVVGDYQKAFAELRFTVRPPHAHIGNPTNFLELYKEAYLRQPEFRYVYLVEDDVLVAQDFFRWHEAVQVRGDYFCTVGWHCVRNPDVKPGTDPNEYIESLRDFSSIGICWRHEKLAAFVRHATPEYYRSMANYLRGAFPGSPIPAGQWTEQAGIVTRLLHETRNRTVAWPVSRRCSHVGVSGYHRPNGHRFGGDMDERIKALRAAVYSKGIQGMSHDFTDDIEPVLPCQHWLPENLRVVMQVPYVEGKI